MVYLDENFPEHPKVIRAAELLGGNGAKASVIALCVTALCHARKFFTGGKVSHAWARETCVTDAAKVIKVLTDPSVTLWHKVEGGYQIHDYQQWNAKSSDIRRKRALAKRRQQRFRSRAQKRVTR